jgi:hypothetical protein
MSDLMSGIEFYNDMTLLVKILLTLIFKLIYVRFQVR